MFRPVCLTLVACLAVSGSCYAAQNTSGAVFASQQGNWVTIYQNDFAGMHYAGGITKNAACVSEAKKKVNEFRDLGMSVSTRLLMSDMAAFEVTGRDSFLVFCNANGALLVNMLVSGASADAMAKGEMSGTQGRSGDPEPIVSRTIIDVNTGKATTTTVVPP